MGQECCESGCCEAKSEWCCQSCCSEEKSMPEMMMRLANEAWEGLMREKMKAAYEKAIGDRMDKAAQVSVEACINYWNNKMSGKASMAEFEQKIGKAMMQ